MTDWAKAQEKRRQKIILDNQRLIDLVRYCRHRLHAENLITDEEFADLVKVGSESARRLENYDWMRARIKELEDTLHKTLDGYARLRLALQDFRDHGVRADLNPTMAPKGMWDAIERLYAYLRRVDKSVRERATKALEGQ